MGWIKAERQKQQMLEGSPRVAGWFSEAYLRGRLRKRPAWVLLLLREEGSGGPHCWGGRRASL